jgi:hypothetical protein
MVSEKKPSIYSDRGTIGSADELDEYGVWVKSGPQDLSSAVAGVQEFDDLSLPDFEMDIGEPPADTAFADNGDEAQTEFEEIDDLQIPPGDIPSDDFDETGTAESAAGDEALGVDDGSDAGFDEFSIPEDSTGETAAELNTGDIADAPEQGSQSDLSTQLLMKIADELSSIRTELTTLKKEFAGIRVNAPAEDETGAQQHGGFFSGEEDEKIALTGDEMNNILSTAEFTEESGEAEEPDSGILFSGETDDFASAAVQDEPVPADDDFISLEEDITPFEEDVTSVEEDLTSAQEDLTFIEEDTTVADTGTAEPSASDVDEAGEEEEIEIDFEDLGIDLNIDPSDFDKAREEPAPENPAEETTEDASFADMAIDLDTQDFSADDLSALAEDSAAAESLLDENLLEEKTAEEELFTEDTALEAGGELEPGEIALVDEFEESEEMRQLRAEGVEPMTSAPEDSSYLEDDPLAAVITEEQDLDAASLDLSEAVIDEPDLSGGITENPVEEPALDAISLDGFEDISVDLEDEQLDVLAGETAAEELELPVPENMEDDASLELNLATEDDGLAQEVIPEAFEAETAEAPIPFDDDLENAFDLTEDIVSIENPEPAPGPAEGSPLELDTSAVSAAAIDEEPVAEETFDIPEGLKHELKTVLSYMDQLLESLPEEKIEEFAKSEYFDSYKKLFKELGLV